MRNLWLILLSCSVMLLLSCSKSTPGVGNGSGAPTYSISIPNNAVNLGSAAFGTNPLSLAAGTVVTWTNNDSTDIHGIQWISQPASSSLTNSSSFSNGSSVTYTLSAVGTYNYQCIVHGSSMTGSIVTH